MKLRFWILLALGGLAILASSTPVFRDSGSGGGESQSAPQVFDTILADSYAGWAGFHVCKELPLPKHWLCWAELHRGVRYRQVEIALDMSQSNPVPTEVVHRDPWTRGPIHIAAPEGHGTANTREYEWEFLMQTLPRDRLPVSFLDVDGDATGFPREMFLFRCTGTRSHVTCRNALGDYLAFTPNVL